MEEEDKDYGYFTLKSDALRKVISDLVKSLESLLAEKKDFNKGINETLKELRKRISTATEALIDAEAKDKAANV